MITHAAFPKTLLYCFIGPPRGGGLFYGGASRTRTYGLAALGHQHFPLAASATGGAKSVFNVAPLLLPPLAA